MEFEKEAQAPMQLVTPSLRDLPRYVETLRRDGSPDNLRGAAAARLSRRDAGPSLPHRRGRPMIRECA
jgi:hypothetical protein